MSAIRSIDGRPVIDARHDAELHILPRDCKRGGRRQPDTCAAAIAAKRQLNAIEVRVHLSRIYVRSNEGNWQRYITTEPLKHEIIVFDRGGRMEPGKYMMLAPRKSQRAGYYHKGKPGKKTGKKRRPARHVENVRLGPSNE